MLLQLVCITPWIPTFQNAYVSRAAPASTTKQAANLLLDAVDAAHALCSLYALLPSSQARLLNCPTATRKSFDLLRSSQPVSCLRWCLTCAPCFFCCATAALHPHLDGTSKHIVLAVLPCLPVVCTAAKLQPLACVCSTATIFFELPPGKNPVYHVEKS